jgi:hypothetical protein
MDYANEGVTSTYDEFIEDLATKYIEGPKYTPAVCDPNMPELTNEYVEPITHELV